MPEGATDFGDEASRLIERLAAKEAQLRGTSYRVTDLPEMKAITGAAVEVQAAVVRAIMRRSFGWRDWFCMSHLLGLMLRRRLPLSEADLLELMERVANLKGLNVWDVPFLGRLVLLVEEQIQLNSCADQFRAALARIGERHSANSSKADAKLHDRIRAILAEESLLRVSPGEAWSDRVLQALESMSEAERAHWRNLLAHCGPSSGSKPSGKWLKTADGLIQKIGWEQFKNTLAEWIPLVDEPRTAIISDRIAGNPDPNQMILDVHQDILKGLAWCCALKSDPELARSVRALAISAYKKIPLLGARAVKVGNACVHAFGAMPESAGVAHLAILRSKVKLPAAQKFIEKALAAAAARQGIPPDEIEELATPAFGFEEVGLRRETFGDYTAELAVTGSASVESRWFRADGKPQKTLPAAVKENHAEELKELKGAAKDAEKMLSASRDRIDSLFLQARSWPYAAWRERYLDHPLVGTLARRLIWEFGAGGAKRSFAFADGTLVDADDKPIGPAVESATVSLWHPIGKPIEEIMAWRAWLERREIQQPFKQAHREVYILTDAERATRTYSNRFAAHILRQHQFNALCGVRGWRNQLRMVFDVEYPPATRFLPRWNLRAEYWVEGTGAGYGHDGNAAGTYNEVVTDQVRFYPKEARENLAHGGGGGYRGESGDPIPLDRVPPLVFSEVMRDVDLFVGVASVGNDPAWSDGGPEGCHRDYWQSYAFGELSGSAQSRKETLQGLIPRLRIAARCSFEDRFLVVRGDIRSYKIHLGSGNILMAPDNQYLCIVRAQGRGAQGAEKVFLPFEGDGMLAVILSKAFMLAGDSTITDPTITRQIGGK